MSDSPRNQEINEFDIDAFMEISDFFSDETAIEELYPIQSSLLNSHDVPIIDGALTLKQIEINKNLIEYKNKYYFRNDTVVIPHIVDMKPKNSSLSSSSNNNNNNKRSPTTDIENFIKSKLAKTKPYTVEENDLKKSDFKKKKLIKLHEDVEAAKRENIFLRRFLQENTTYVSVDSLANITQPVSAVLDSNSIHHDVSLLEPDYRLHDAIQKFQQNYIIIDALDKNLPIIYISPGFCKLTGYKRDHCIGKHMNLLSGDDTNQETLKIMMDSLSFGYDTSVCLLNYKANKTPFYNQIYIAPIRNCENKIIKYISIHCDVSSEDLVGTKSRIVKRCFP